MAISYHWEFPEVEITDLNNLANTIVTLRGELVAVDETTGNMETEVYTCFYDAPDADSFTAFTDLTPNQLRDWIIDFYGSHDRGAWPHGPEAWVERQKLKLADRLKARTAIRRTAIRGIGSDTTQGA